MHTGASRHVKAKRVCRLVCCVPHHVVLAPFFQAWAREGRHDALQTMFQALVDERGIRGSPTHPAAIRLGTLYGVVRLALAQLGEMYAMPAQNMSFLRPVPPVSGDSWHTLLPHLTCMVCMVLSY